MMLLMLFLLFLFVFVLCVKYDPLILPLGCLGNCVVQGARDEISQLSSHRRSWLGERESLHDEGHKEKMRCVAAESALGGE